MDEISSIFSKIKELLVYDPTNPMLFSSGLFLFLFAGFAFFYRFMRRTVMLRILYVVCFSLYFYFKTSGIYFLLLVALSLSDFLIGHFLSRTMGQGARKGCVVLSVTIDLGILCYF